MKNTLEYEDRSCKWCATIFKPNRKDKQFCTKLCYKRWGKKFKGHSDGSVETRKYNRRPHTKYKKVVCEQCGFQPQHLCQLDVHHLDGNHSNNEPVNLQTLCANCHRLETAKQLGWT